MHQLQRCPGFDPSIRRHSGIWGAADEAVLNIVRQKIKSPPKIFLKNIKHKNCRIFDLHTSSYDICGFAIAEWAQEFADFLFDFKKACLHTSCWLSEMNIVDLWLWLGGEVLRAAGGVSWQHHFLVQPVPHPCWHIHHHHMQLHRQPVQGRTTAMSFLHFVN